MARLKKHDLQVLDTNKSTVSCVVEGDMVSLCEFSMSTDTDNVAALTQYFSELMRSDPKVLKVMGKRPRKTSFQVNRDQFVKNLQNMESWDSYKDAHKQDTLMWQEKKDEKFWRCDAKTFYYPSHRKDRKP